MSVENYYLAEKMYAYPSSNANDGGEDNTEDNLRMITEKITPYNYLMHRDDGWETCLVPSYSSRPLGIRVSAGECCINGYYFKLDEMILQTTDINGNSLLTSNTEYTLALCIYKDGAGNLRGDGMSVTYPNIDKLESHAISLGAYTKEDFDVLDKKYLIKLATFTTDKSAYPPTSPQEYILNKLRFTAFDASMISGSDGMTLLEWTDAQITAQIAAQAGCRWEDF